MKRQELVVIKGLTIKELLEKAKVLKKEIAELTLDKNRNKLKDLKSISRKRKDLAQVLTILNAKQILEQLEPKVEEKQAVKKGVKQ